MKKVLSTLVLGALAFTGTAQAGWYYDGPSVDINFIQTKPAKYGVCDRYLQDTSPKQVYAVCEFARDEAERMAERFGGGNGRIYGYMTGLSYSVYKFANLASGDPSSVAEGEHAVSGMGAYMQKGLQAGIDSGNERGTSRGDSDAFGRFKAAVNTGKEPNLTMSVPAVSFTPVQNAYEKYGCDYAPCAHPTVQSIIQNELSSQLGEIKVYHDYDATYMDQMTPPTWFDVWGYNGAYSFEKAHWAEGNKAVDTWKRRPIDTKPKYEALDQVPLIGVDGKPIVLKKVFEDAFKGAYEYYVNYYFSQQFYRSRDDGARDGEMVGSQIGKRVAFYNGLEAEFNRQYNKSAEATFRGAFENAYKGSFAKRAKYLSENSYLEVSFRSLFGDVDDGIIQPGERVGADFGVTNIGAVPSSFEAYLSGSVQENSSQMFSIARLRSQGFRSNLFATIDPRVSTGSHVRLALNVRDAANSVSASLDQEVNNQVEFKGMPRPEVNVQQGNGHVLVAAENISTKETASTVTADLIISGRVVHTQTFGKLLPGEVKEVSLEFSKVDPMVFINGSLSGKVVVSLGGRAVDEKEFSVGSSDKASDAAQYLVSLLNNEAFVPAGVNVTTRIAELSTMLTEEVHNETFNIAKGDNVWGENPLSTTIGKLVSIYKNSKLSDAALARFNTIAIEVNKCRGHFKNLVGAKRKSFIALTEQLWSTKASGGISLDKAKAKQHQGQAQ